MSFYSILVSADRPPPPAAAGRAPTPENIRALFEKSIINQQQQQQQSSGEEPCFRLPVTTLEQLDCLEEKLKDKGIRQQLVRRRILQLYPSSSSSILYIVFAALQWDVLPVPESRTQQREVMLQIVDGELLAVLSTRARPHTRKYTALMLINGMYIIYSTTTYVHHPIMVVCLSCLLDSQVDVGDWPLVGGVFHGAGRSVHGRQKKEPQQAVQWRSAPDC